MRRTAAFHARPAHFRVLPALAVPLILFLPSATMAAQERVDAAMNARIRAEGLERSQVVATFTTLADIIGPRLTGTPAYRQSAEWTRGKLREWGLTDPRLEPFEFGRGWTLEKLTLELTAPRYFPISGYPEAWTPSTAGVLSGAPLYIGEMNVAQIEALGERLRGAVILQQRPQMEFRTADRPQPADSDTSVRIGAPPVVRSTAAAPAGEVNQILRRFGAGAVLRPSQGQHGTIFVLGNRNTAGDAVPAIVVATEHYNMLVRLAESGTRMSVRVEVGVRYHEDNPGSFNVIAELPGTDPLLRDQVVLIGAHLDSWHSATGATDNADGVATAMEAMRILKALNARPRRTIRIALWGGEEQGLLGSRAYVERHHAGSPNTGAGVANTAAREVVSVYLNDDPGSGATYGFYMQDNAAAKAIFDTWLEPFRDLGMRRNVIDPIGNTDHLSFLRVGIPGFTTIKDYRNYDVRTHHTNADFHERVAAADLKQSAVVLASFAWHAAMRDDLIPRPTPSAR